MESYRCIVADPPWLERGGGKSKRGADRHYQLLDKKQIVEAMRSSGYWRPANPCHLWLWATSNYLKDALWVMEVLGFEYKTSAAWVKMQISYDAVMSPVTNALTQIRLQTGLGQYLRHCHEWLLLGTYGRADVPPPELRQPSVILAPRTKHSAKPIEAYTMIECTSDTPRLEMFARQPREGWDVWGNDPALFA